MDEGGGPDKGTGRDDDMASEWDMPRFTVPLWPSDMSLVKLLLPRSRPSNSTSRKSRPLGKWPTI